MHAAYPALPAKLRWRGRLASNVFWVQTCFGRDIDHDETGLSTFMNASALRPPTCPKWSAAQEHTVAVAATWTERFSWAAIMMYSKQFWEECSFIEDKSGKQASESDIHVAPPMSNGCMSIMMGKKQ